MSKCCIFPAHLINMSQNLVTWLLDRMENEGQQSTSLNYRNQENMATLPMEIRELVERNGGTTVLTLTDPDLIDKMILKSGGSEADLPRTRREYFELVVEVTVVVITGPNVIHITTTITMRLKLKQEVENEMNSFSRFLARSGANSSNFNAQGSIQQGGSAASTSQSSGRVAVLIPPRNLQPGRLPRILFTNAHSLGNKEEDFDDLVEKGLIDQCDLLFICETWLKDGKQHPIIPGFTCVRVDRDLEKARKQGGGGLIVYVRKHWAHEARVIRQEDSTTHALEYLVLKIQPYGYSWREDPLVFIHVYAFGNPSDASGVLKRVHSQYTNPPHSIDPNNIFIIGDFNKTQLPNDEGFEQYVTCTTRKENTLDKCYGKMQGAYRSVSEGPLGTSDHNCIWLFPFENDKGKKCKCKNCQK